MTIEDKLPMLLVVLLSSFCVSCGSESPAYAVAGVEGYFCIPKEYELGTAFWMPMDRSEYLDGFVVKGCWGRDMGGRSCALPDNVVNISVSSVEDFISQDYDNIPTDAFYRRIADAHSTHIEVSPGGSDVVVYNKDMSPLWFVWRHMHAIGEEPTALGPGDVLAATCEEKGVTSDAIDRATIFCERKVLLKDYSVSYSFRTKERVPENLELLDSKISQVIDGWRCIK